MKKVKQIYCKFQSGEAVRRRRISQGKVEKKKYKIMLHQTHGQFLIFFKNGKADSVKEAMTIEVSTINTKSFKTQIRYKPTSIKINRSNAPVDMDIDCMPFIIIHNFIITYKRIFLEMLEF